MRGLNLLISFIVACFAAVAVAQNPAPATTAVAPWAAYVDDQTIGIVHVAMTAEEFKGLGVWWSGVCKQAAIDPEEAQAIDQESQKSLAIANRWVEEFQKAGGRDIYGIGSLAEFQSSPGFLLVPVKAGANVETLVKLLTPQNVGNPDSNRAMTAECIGDVVIMGSKATLQRLSTMTPSARPDLAKALAAAGAGPCRAAFTLTPEASQFIEQMIPALPRVLGGGPPTIITNGISSMTLSVNLPPKPSLQWRVQSLDAQSAQDFSKFWAAYLNMFKREIKLPKETAQLFQAITPTVAGDQLTLALDNAAIDKLTTQMMPVLQKARQEAKRIASMSNMRQLLLAMMMYANDNHGEAPADLQALMPYCGKNPQSLNLLLTNPAQPKRPIGYIYVKPVGKIRQLPPNTTVVLYEAFEQWPGQLNVGFVDGHVEAITSQQRFEALIKGDAK